ncbi:MAG: hypothetical protein CSB48_10070 [Proteobacteria bacterium]|nr:MAG: hypothetical protein CSB48_10070 [Pseudomonadota bacterium]
MNKPTGPGRTERRNSPKSLLLYNFDINGDRLKPEHEAFLRKEVVPVLQRGGSVSLVGLASRSGSASYNQALSERRAKSALAFLQKAVTKKFAVRTLTGFGEDKAKQEGYRDSTEDQRFRSVVVFVSAASIPPVPPKKPPGPKDRVLVVLLENGGIKIDVAAILSKLKKLLLLQKLLLPDAVERLIPDSALKLAGDHIKEQIKKKTDTILESADLLLNRFNSAVPAHYGKVIILRDSSASYTDLKNALVDQTKADKIIDLFILTHGGTDSISVKGGINSAKIVEIKTKHNGGTPLNLRAVYMMNCVGSSLNEAWVKAGAKVSSGTIRNNYLPEPSMYLFWNNWKGGQSFRGSVEGSYKSTIGIMNNIIRSLPIGGYLAREINVRNLDFIKDSKPVIKGDGSLTIKSPH